jgi:prepilin-type N-terminal cleavage/methylation domain-containing protein
MTRRDESRRSDRSDRDRQSSRVRGDGGFSLVEMMVVLLALSVLLAISIPVVSTVFQTQSRIDQTYTNVNQQLELSTNLQRLLRAAVAPASSYDGATQTATSPPVTPFELGHITPTSLTFYANTGTTHGPEQVTASCTQTSTHTTLCAPTATFTLTITPAKATTCPFNQTTTTFHCTWPSTATRQLLELPYVTNGDSSTAEPLFTYAYGTKTVCSDGLPSGCSGSDSVTFSSTHCSPDLSNPTGAPFATCPAGEITEVYYVLRFDVKVTHSTKAKTTAQYGGFVAKTVSGTFVMSSTSALYSPAVG